MDIKDRIIVALDVEIFERAKPLIEDLIPHVNYFKVGLNLISTGESQQTAEFVHNARGKVFLDGKLNDIPNTIKEASKAIRKKGVEMFNLHCSVGAAGMIAAREGVNKAFSTDETIMVDYKILHTEPKILGVTILTSHNYDSLVETGFFEELNIANIQELRQIQRQRMEALVIRLALLAQDNGLDGVIASPHEIEAIRNCCQPEFLVVTPGVRPKWANVNDQKRVMTAAEAIQRGADHLVIGRPITQPPPDIGTPIDAVKLIPDEINSVL